MTQNQDFSLHNKIAFVTGGSRSIGAAIAKRLAAEGAKVALTYNASEEQAYAVVQAIKQAGGDAIAYKADAADAQAVQSAIEKAAQHYGGLDILVNNAGIGFVKPIEEFTLDDFDRIVAINVKGVFVAIQTALRFMQSGARIINIGSINSAYVPYNGAALYVLTKGAIAGMTRAMARDLGPRGITINNVMPGPTDTDMNPANSAKAEFSKQIIALKRYGLAEEIADFVAYLASPGASYITGADLAIDGGYSA